MTPNQNPEQKARDNIDKLLLQSGWVVQNKNKINYEDLVAINDVYTPHNIHDAIT